MTDLDAIIQAAEETRAESWRKLTGPKLLDYDSTIAVNAVEEAFRSFVIKLKALRQGIYG